MKKYIRLIKPVRCHPNQYYGPVTEDLESPEVWYPEDREAELREKYKDVNGPFSDLMFESRYVSEYRQAGMTQEK